ncbi:ABC transporter ATP-binding protein [Sedimentibacter sp. zth1]|uniref:ABC transporter ATP-binding protein n=1 Tax=Sedimentibacter sp. zth1 TaxID=2816908 RepID=UPI001A9384F8|nr:ABC transporter ATP-binding protein [Sedimentibacter sp. zth1]QSX04869.1 ABC transporter ATP-binding protein [Sedimentibacter sp. zth1]
MIKVEHLYHSYSNDEHYSVSDVSFEVKKGEIFGFLGPSGAGKSTTQNILTGLLTLQKGKVIVDGYDISKEDKRRFNKIGVSFEQSNLYSKLTAEENLRYYAKLYDVPTRDVKELIAMVGLKGKEKQKVGEFSKGMKHRLTFARSLINKPELWFLDEPTTGLDPAIAAGIKDIIRKECDKGTTAFLTTHNMYIAEELCDRVAFIIDGKIMLIDSPKNLKLQYGEKTIEVEYIGNGIVKKENLAPAVKEEKARLNEIINNCEIITMHSKEATLEEIFIKVTGKGLTSDESVE